MGVNGIYGLSGSGLDIESLVKMGMQTKQSQYNKMQQTEISKTWLKEAYTNVYSDLQTYKLDTLSSFKLSSTTMAMSATSSNANAVTATANAAAASMTHSVSVTSMATNAYVLTDNGKTVDRANQDKSAASSNKLRDILFSSYSKDGTEEVEDEKDSSKTNTVNKYIVDGQSVKGTDVAMSITFSDGSNSGTIKYTYDDLLSDNAKTLNDFAAAITNSGANLQGSYDAANDSFAIFAKEGGSKNTVGITVNNDNGAKLLNSMHLAQYNMNDDSLTALSSFSVGSSGLTSKALSGDDLRDTLGYKVRAMTSDEVKAYNDLLIADDKNATTLDTSKTYYITYTTDTMASNLSADDAAAFETENSGKAFKKIDNGDGTFTYTMDNQTGIYSAGDVAVNFSVSDGENATAVKYTFAELAAGVSMADMATALNDGMADAGSTLTVAYDSSAKTFSFNNANGGVSIKSMSDEASTLLNNMGLSDASGSKSFSTGNTTGTSSVAIAGTDAVVRIDGKDYTSNSNKLTVAGVTYTFNGVTDPGTTSKITVSQDTDKVVENVKSFVEAYNKILDSLNEKLSEERYSDYKPLSSFQEEQMTEKQIEKWNEKAKSGLLYRDSTIRDLVSSMREAIYTKVDAVDSKYNTMSSIGISSSNIKGHLTLDEDKLKKALAEDPDCVYQLFASDQDSAYIEGTTNTNKITEAQRKNDYKNTGIAWRLSNVMDKYSSSIADIAGVSKDTNDQSYLGKLITNMQTKMSTFKSMMSAFEKQLYKRYDAMEVALSKLGTQMSYIVGGE